jgi:hypothetical protein
MLARQLLSAEQRGDMRTYRALLRLPLSEVTVVELYEEPILFGRFVETFPEDKLVHTDTVRFVPRARQYRDLEYPRKGKRSRNAQLRRTGR